MAAAQAVGAHDFIERLPDGYDTRGGRARRATVGGPAPARGVRARRGGGPAHPDPRRGDVERGRADRGADRTRAAPAARRPHGDRDRPSPVHDSRRGPHRRAGPRRASPSRERTRSCSTRTGRTRASTATGRTSRPPDTGSLPSVGRGLALVVGVAALLVLPASASATVTMTDFKVEPSSKQGGGHPSVTITQSFSYDNTTDSVKDAFVRLQPGLLGNPQSRGVLQPGPVPGGHLPGRLDRGERRDRCDRIRAAADRPCRPRATASSTT